MNKKDERRETSVRVVSAQEKLAEASETFGSCLDKAEEVMGALTRVVMTQRTTVEKVRSSRVCTDKAEGCKGVSVMGLSSQLSGFFF